MLCKSRSRELLGGADSIDLYLQSGDEILCDLGSGLFGNGLGGKEILRETRGVGVKELLDALRLRGLDHEAGVVIFRDAADDFRILVSGGVRFFLTSARDDDAGIVAPRGGHVPGPLSSPNFHARPFAAALHLRRSLHPLTLFLPPPSPRT